MWERDRTQQCRANDSGGKPKKEMEQNFLYVAGRRDIDREKVEYLSALICPQ